MRDNFNVHEWKIDQIRKENLSEQLDDEKAVQAIASAVAEYAEIDNNKYLQGVIRTALGSGYLKEGWNDDIDKIDLIYTNYGTLYKVKVNDKTVNAKDVEDLIGMEIPIKGYYSSEEVLNVVDALKRKGIEADAYEMDVD